MWMTIPGMTELTNQIEQSIKDPHYVQPKVPQQPRLLQPKAVAVSNATVVVIKSDSQDSTEDDEFDIRASSTKDQQQQQQQQQLLAVKQQPVPKLQIAVRKEPEIIELDDSDSN
jgi:hypothetical protein